MGVILLESFRTLLVDPGHYEFELFLMLVVDFIGGALLWPRIKAHIHKDNEELHEHVENLEGIHYTLLVQRLQNLEAAVWPHQTFEPVDPSKFRYIADRWGITHAEEID